MDFCMSNSRSTNAKFTKEVVKIMTFTKNVPFLPESPYFLFCSFDCASPEFPEPIKPLIIEICPRIANLKFFYDFFKQNTIKTDF